MNYINHHSHSMYSNLSTPDSTISNEDRTKRCVELGQSVCSYTEHATTGRFIEGIELSKKYGIKPLLGTESYFVKNRFEKDSTNAHIILLAKNENGRKAINLALSEANETGFYYKPRIDLEILLKMPKNDVWVSSACLGGVWKYENNEDLIVQINNHFQENFFLEVQPHHVDKQREINKKVLYLSKKHNIKIIAGMDSHMIYPEQAKERDNYLLSRGIEYPDEDNWFLDFPSYGEAFIRFKDQGVLNNEEIAECLENTLVFESVQEYDSEIFNDKTIKLPTIYPELSQEDRNKKFEKLIWEKWEEEKLNIPNDQWEKYEQEIKKETDTIVETNMSDYFLLDYEIVKRGIEKGGHITLTSRGSCPSFYISKLLGFTTIDRISSKVKLFPERFITKERILETGSLPDLDLNVSDPSVFLEAQNEILGDEHAYPMITFGTMKSSGAWKMYARATGIDFNTANVVSDQIKEYEKSLRYTDEEEKEFISIYQFIDNKYHKIYDESTKYLNLVNSLSIHPCASLLMNKNLKEEFGLIRIKSTASGSDNLCVNCDGLFAEKYKMLKNDLLKVDVVDLIYKTYDKINIEPHTVPELIEVCKDNEKVWDIYENGYTIGINQFEKDATSKKGMRYSPKNISELSAFISAIRPGFKSEYSTFEQRKPFSFNVRTLDEIIQTDEFPYSFMLYQENTMAVLAYAGIPIGDTYAIIKNIAKKRYDKVMAVKNQFVKGMTKRLIENESIKKKEADNVAKKTWQVIEDSAFYQFNACVSGSTIIQRAGRYKNQFNPTIEEMFKIKNNKEYAKKTNHLDLHNKYRRYGYGNALSMFEDKRIRKNKIINIYYSGIKEIFEIETENGSNIICTNNHKFPTPQGDKKLEDIKIGDFLYVKGEYDKKQNNKKRRFTTGDPVKNAPKLGERGFQKLENAPSVIFHDIRKDNVKNENPCFICGMEYNNDKRFELHHKDNDKTNNSYDNLVWLCVSCHKKEHYKMNRRKTYEKGIPVEIEKVVSIKKIGIDNVYDIEMDDPAHNFISETGLVTSNSHSYSVAGDSLYGAYLKSHYPLQFYSSFMQIMEEKGDKDRLILAKQESQKAFGINFPIFKFGQDNRSITYDTKTNSINMSLRSIKGFGQKVSDDMYDLHQNFKPNPNTTFLDLLIYATDNSLISSKFEDLIKIRYFEEFGKNKKLYQFYEEFTKGKNRYSKTHTDKTKEKRIPELEKIWNELENKNFSIHEQVANELSILGEIQTNFPVNKNYAVAIEVDTKYSPRILFQNLSNGDRKEFKVSKKTYNEFPIHKGSILLFKKVNKKNKVKKNEEGSWDKIEDSFDYWLEVYYTMTENDKFLR